jgi:hypothetical protein
MNEPNLPEKPDAPPVSSVPGVANPATYWPASLAHLALPCDNPGSDYVTVAEISEAPVAGYDGFRKISVALVPLGLVDELLQSTAATGHEIESQGPLPIIGDDGPPHRNGFWIEGIDRDTRFEPVVNSWRGSDIDVVLPDNSLLMVFGLVPRQTGLSAVSWDDPRGPVYDVVRASMTSDHQLPKEQRQRAFVEIRRDYLMEYCRIKQAAAVAFYYEQRRSDDDAVFNRALVGDDNKDFHLPGRLLNLQVSRDANERGRQLAQVWGRRMVLPRGERRVIVVDDPELVWPDHAGQMTMNRAGREHAMAYVSDQVLVDYEGRPEFEIHPLSGGVSYRGQWSVGHCQRFGRGHIAVEIKKLYEGCPSPVIQHWHRFAVPRAVADAERQANGGSRNIAIRARDLVQAYLALTNALSQVAERMGLSFEQGDIGGFSSAKVEYHGWWTFDALSSLAKVVPLSVTLNGFLDRTVAVVILWESVQPAPLRNMLLKLGIDRKAMNQFGSVKLLGTLCQLATIAKDGGHRWPEDSLHFVDQWEKDVRLPALRRLFAVNQLRQKAAHRAGNDFAASFAADLQAFDIVPAAQAAGWGQAVDAVYDGLVADFNAIAALLSPSE